MTRNVFPLHPSDKKMIEGEVGYIELRAMPSARATHASHRARAGLGHAVGVAIAKPPFGERLVRFFRRWQFRIFVACYVVAVATACYFAFQVGLGVL